MTQISVPRPRATPELGRAGALRAEFDNSFALPARRDTTALVDVLAFRIDQELLAVQLSEVAEMVANPIVTTVPATVSQLRGLAAARGRVVAAYDLSRLLGGAGAPPGWMIVPAAEPSIGLTFGHFEGHRKIPLSNSFGPGNIGRLIGLPGLIDAVRTLSPSSPHRIGDTQ